MRDKKNQYDDFGILSDYKNLYNAHLSCRKGKRWKDSVASYDMRAPECTLYLKYLLETGQYRIGEYKCFTINERGKEREIKSVKYKDRVVQKCLNDNILTPCMIPKLIYENGASQKGKGTDFHLKLLKRHMQEHYKKHGAAGYILIGDFKSYFDSIAHELVNEIYKKEFKDTRLIGLIEAIHASTQGEKGLPLGNQLSQMDALLAANAMDHMVKERLRIRGYGRYMDDFYLIHKDKEYLRYCLNEIEKEVTAIGLRLNKKKTKIVPLTAGIDFLGFHFYLTETGKVVMKIKAESKNRERRRLRKFRDRVKAGKMTFEDAAGSYRCWKAHAQRGDTYYMLRDMDFYFDTLFYDYLSETEKNRYEKLKVENARRREKRNAKTVKQPSGGVVG